MDDKMLLFIVENFTNHENPELRREAEKAWAILRERGREIERELESVPFTVPKDAKTEQEMLDDIMEILHGEKA